MQITVVRSNASSERVADDWEYAIDGFPPAALPSAAECEALSNRLMKLGAICAAGFDAELVSENDQLRLFTNAETSHWFVYALKCMLDGNSSGGVDEFEYQIDDMSYVMDSAGSISRI